ncbi:MAG TPA: sigma-70 family RNA polymerase sigma factor [Burkholderiaceae bacterium]|nr:sigma-70 family RNA polymerase sigma factor [Burkholderiaceae bacterium]
MKSTDIIAQIPSLRRYARVLTGDSWAADDLVQDTLERACSKWRLWTMGTHSRAWLFSIMHNLFIDDIRRSSSQMRKSIVSLDDVANELIAPENQHTQLLDLERCLQRLPADQRAVLLLVGLENLTYEEVAKIAKIPIGTVMSRLSRARARLQQLLEAPASTGHGSSISAQTESDHSPTLLRRLK